MKLTIRSVLAPAASLALALVVSTGPLVAQASLESSALFASSYVFRGLTLTNVPTVQPKFVVAIPAAGGTVTMGAEGNVEFAVPAEANTISEGGGVSGLNEFHLVAQYSHHAGPATVALGATRFQFSGHNEVLSPAWNTTELFVGARAEHFPGRPSVTANWDVQTIHGVYVETAAAQELHAGRFAPVLGLLAGWSLGQEEQGAVDEYFAYDRRGLTHVDASVAQHLSAFGLSMTPAVHVQFAPVGQSTRITGALAENHDRATKVWFGVDIGWATRHEEH